MAVEVRAARRRRGDREQHLGGDQGPRRAEDRLGRRPQRQLRIRWPTGRSWRRPRASPGKVVRNEGDADAALKSAAKVIIGEYYVPHLAHATMEPPAAVARRRGRQVRRSGRRCRAPAARATTSPRRSASPEENVTVNVTLLGGGFGRKSKCDFALEAALLSKELGGAPVKVRVDARGRHPARLLPHRVGGAHRGRPRRRAAR